MATLWEASDTNPRPERIVARLSSEAKASSSAADIGGRSVSDFVVMSALEAAREMIRKHEVIVLSARDSNTFVEALLNPKWPSEELFAATRRHRELFGPVE